MLIQDPVHATAQLRANFRAYEVCVGLDRHISVSLILAGKSDGANRRTNHRPRGVIAVDSVRSSAVKGAVGRDWRASAFALEESAEEAG